jgi:hypothetical protein
MPERLQRSQLSEEERRVRSQLAQLVSSYGFVRGNLSVREKVCGKPNCRCARGEKHLAIYLVASDGGHLRQLFIPPSLEAKAREWIENHQRIRQLLEELSQIAWDRLKRREP